MALLLIYLTLRSPAGLIIAKKLFNGQSSNGAPKRDLAGEASVDYWQNLGGQMLSDAFEKHERDDQRRYEDQLHRYNELRETMRELHQGQREAIQVMKEGIDRIVDGLHNVCRK